MLIAAFVARLILAKEYFLNPDEALHYLSASQPSVDLAYKAALTNAHPPLLILVLYYWRSFGQSELILRAPSVLAGTACCWLAYRWLKEVTHRSTAFMGLLLLPFAPSMIVLSAEVRQYALLLFFIAGCLYLSERAIQENSRPLMMLFSLCLYGALLTHYSSLLFAFTMGIYMLLRLYPYGKRPGLFAVWVRGQIGALVLVTYFLITHVAHLRATGMPRQIAETWLRKSIFHPGDQNVAVFASAQTVRVSTYLFSHGLVGTLALLAFLAGMVSLLREQTPWNKDGPTPRELALLFSLPFVVNCGAAIAGLNPYGGTRHNAFLAPFAVGGAVIGLAAWIPARLWAKSLVIIIALALCNFFPPPAAYQGSKSFRGTDEKCGGLLRQSAPPGSVLLADYQSGLALGYYACNHGIVQIFPPLQLFAKADCGPYTVITAGTQEWRFNADDLPSQLANVAETYGLAPGTRVWLFDAGWITDLAPPLTSENRCSAPRTFGENILICQLTVGGHTGSATDRTITK